MIKGYRAEKLNKDLKKIAYDFRNQYEARRSESEKIYKASMLPGQVFNPKNGFYEDTQRKLFSDEAAEYAKSAHELLDGITLELMSEATKAPSTEAVNAITLLASRKNISADELDMFLSRYGSDCPLAYKSLKEIAESHDHYIFKDHPLGEQAENVQVLNNMIDRVFNPLNAENVSLIATVDGFCANVDLAFPTEE